MLPAGFSGHLLVRGRLLGLAPLAPAAVVAPLRPVAVLVLSRHIELRSLGHEGRRRRRNPRTGSPREHLPDEVPPGGRRPSCDAHGEEGARELTPRRRDGHGHDAARETAR